MAFGTNGATLGTPPPSGGFINNLNQIPQTYGGRALGAIGGFLGNAFNNLKNSNDTSLKQPFNPALPNGGQGTTSGLLSSTNHVTPTQHPTKVVTKNADGSSTETSYIGGGTGKTTDSGNGTNKGSTGGSNAGGSSTSTTPVTVGTGTSSGGTGSTSGSDTGGESTTSGLNQYGQPNGTPITLGQIAKATGQNAPVQPTQNGTNVPATVPATVGGIASAEANFQNPALIQAGKNVANLQTQEGQVVGGLQRQPMTAGSLTGAAGTATSQYANDILAAQGQEQIAQTAGGQTLTGLNQAGGQIGYQQSSPGTSEFNPATGTFVPTLAGTQNGTNGLEGIGAIGGQIENGQTQTTLNANLGQAQTTGKDLQNIIKTGNINPTNFPAINQLAQWFNSGVVSGTGNEKYQEFAGEMNDFINKMAPILTGGSTTNMANEMASAMINAGASGQSISDVIDHYLALAKSNVQAIGTGGGAGVGSTSGGNSGGTVSAGGYTFIQNSDGSYSAQ